MTYPVLLRPECVAAVDGDMVVGLLLSQIVYWYLPSKAGTTKLTHKPRYGHLWIAKTREEWMAETGLTLKRYKRAIGVLKRKGLVEVRVMRRKNMAFSHLRLLTPIEEVGKGPTGWAERDQPNRSIENTSREYKKKRNLRIGESRFAKGGSLTVHGGNGSRDREEVTIRKEVKIETEVTTVDPEQDQYSFRVDIPIHWRQKGGWLVKATDIIAAKHGSTNGSLEGWWKSRMALITQSYQKALTVKERGQLKLLSNYLGERTKPVITYTIEHWCKFSSVAGAVAGVSPPAEPHIGFLLKYHAVAVNLLYPPQTPPSVAASPVVSCTQVQPLPVPVEEAYVPSPQELAEMLTFFKSP
jgi:hypothetical protein